MLAKLAFFPCDNDSHRAAPFLRVADQFLEIAFGDDRLVFVVHDDARLKRVTAWVTELDSLGIEFVSRREGVATGDAMGRLFMTIISAIAELERSLVVERVKSGMRRARLEGRQVGRSRLDVDREQVVVDRRSGLSLTQVAKKHGISRASVCRLMKEANDNSDPAALVPEVSIRQEAHV